MTPSSFTPVPLSNLWTDLGPPLSERGTFIHAKRLLQHNTCGRVSEFWANNVRKGSYRCRFCFGTGKRELQVGDTSNFLRISNGVPSRHASFPPALTSTDTFWIKADRGAYLQVTLQGEPPPQTPDLTPKQSVIPDPPSGYEFHLLCPVLFSKYIAGLEDLSDTLQTMADEWFDERLEEIGNPPKLFFSPTFLLDGTETVYMAWTGRTGWRLRPEFLEREAQKKALSTVVPRLSDLAPV